MGPGEWPGGSYLLDRELELYGEEISADFRQYYGIGVGSLYTDPSFTPQEAIILLRQLPAGARYFAAIKGDPDYVGWDESRYLQAGLFNLMKNLIWVTAKVAVGKKHVDKPVMYPLPGSKARQAKPASDDIGNTRSFGGMLAAAKAAAERI